MNLIALKMLFGDRAKYFGLVFAIAFASMLIAHQTSIFVGLMRRTTSQIRDVADAEVWVMDPRVQYFDENEPLTDNDLLRVRGVEGVEWAVPLAKILARAKTAEGRFQVAFLLGHDDATLVGAPRTMLHGSVADLRRPDGVIVDDVGFGFFWPGEPLALGKTLEMNDRRAVVVGICRANPPFQTVPLLYTRYSQALQYTGGERKQMSFVLAHPAPGIPQEELARRIRDKTGLQALPRDDFAWATVRYYLTHTGIPVNFGITIAMAFLVGTVVAGQTFYIFTIENLKQFGALKAIGVGNGRITAMIALQAIVVGGMGFGFGSGLAAAFFAATQNIPHLRAFFLPWQILVGTGGAVIAIVLLASLLSVRRVWFLEPATVFRG
ncbi:MAG: ABC transporter permease [Planctomycetes bacterium]|nr:ABC transporter permease [Planctomycetota bacterium]